MPKHYPLIPVSMLIGHVRVAACAEWTDRRRPVPYRRDVQSRGRPRRVMGMLHHTGRGEQIGGQKPIMLRHIVHDKAAPRTARLEPSIESGQQRENEVEALRFAIEAQRRELDLAFAEVVRHREVSLQVLERLQAMAATISVTGEFCNCTCELARMLHRPVSQMRGESLLDYLTHADRDQFLTLCRECLRSRRDVTFDTHLMLDARESSRVRLMLTEWPGLRGADQTVGAELLVLFTLVKWEDTESTAATIRNKPEAVVASGERRDTIPAPASSGPLEVAQRMTSSDCIGWFAGGVAHEFNNVLTAITCNISLALMELPNDAPAVSLLRDATQATNQASVLTRQLLEFSRRQPAVPEPARIDTLIETSRHLLDQIVGDHIGIRTTHQVDAGVINVDPHQFEMVLINLVRNARDALLGGGTVSIETNNVVVVQKYLSSRPTLSPGSYVTLRVTDNGCGMGKNTLDRLFEPFFTTKARGQGIGLGLTTSLIAVRQSGGGIEVNSTLGHGTAVTVYWPRVLDAVRDPRALHLKMTADGGPETILLVEDQAALRAIGTRILSRLGYRVLSAANGIEALEAAMQYPGRIDLLFTDIVMPGMNGRELALRLKTLRPELKVLFTSGYTERIFDQQAADLSAGNRTAPMRNQDYLAKPYLPEALVGRVREMLRTDRSVPPEALGR